MNLIEKLGGYEKAKGFFIESNGAEWIGVFYMPKLNRDLLEYRRENNIFEVGDLVVYHSLPHKRLFKVHNKGGDSIVIRECWDEAGARCFAENSPYVDIRHATPSEIKAGHRL